MIKTGEWRNIINTFDADRAPGTRICGGHGHVQDLVRAFGRPLDGDDDRISCSNQERIETVAVIHLLFSQATTLSPSRKKLKQLLSFTIYSWQQPCCSQYLYHVRNYSLFGFYFSFNHFSGTWHSSKYWMNYTCTSVSTSHAISGKNLKCNCNAAIYLLFGLRSQLSLAS